MTLNELEKQAKLALEKDEFQQSIELYQQCLEINSNSINYYWYLGLSYLLANQPTEAQEVWMSVILELQLSSDKEDTENSINQLTQLLKHEAQTRYNQGKLQQSVVLYQVLLEFLAEDPIIAYHLAQILLKLGQEKEAVTYLKIATQQQPNFREAWKLLGDTSINLGETKTAIKAYRKLEKLGDQNYVIFRELGLALEVEGEYQEAIKAYQKSLEINPHDPGTQLRLATILPVIPQSNPEIEQARARFKTEINQLLQNPIRLQSPLQEVKKTTFFLAYHGQLNIELQKQVSQVYEKACPSLVWVAPHCQEKRQTSKHQKIKIGFFSTYFRHHTIAKLNRGLIANLSREKFKITVFSPPQTHDRYRDFIQKKVDRFITVPKNLEVARNKISTQELDILFYPEIGMDFFTYLLAFSRLAPIQCVTWGHPMTTGIKNIDYFFSSVALEPENPQNNYTETLICLENLSPYYYPLSLPESLQKTRSELGLPENNHLYICPQSLFKLHPDFDLTLSAILHADPLGKIILLNGGKENYTKLLKKRFEQTIPDVIDQIIILPRLSEADFLNLVLQADVMLDPIYFGGGNTTYEALGLGTPVVTLPGNHLRSRISYGCYQQMDFLDCVAHNIEEYINIAVNIGTNPEYRQIISQRILAQNYKLFQNQEALEEMEQQLLKLCPANS